MIFIFFISLLSLLYYFYINIIIAYYNFNVNMLLILYQFYVKYLKFKNFQIIIEKVVVFIYNSSIKL